MYKTTFTFKLSEKLQYGNKGNLVETDKLVLHSPSNKNRIDVLNLQHIVMTCFKDMQSSLKDVVNTTSNSEKQGDSELGRDEIIGLMFMSENIDLVKLEETFKSLMFSGLCKLDGEVDLTESVYEKLSCDDTNNLMGDYIVNFLLLSLISQPKKK